MKKSMVSLDELQRSTAQVEEPAVRTTISCVLHRPGYYGRLAQLLES